MDVNDDVVALIAKLNSIAPLVAAAAQANYERMLASTAASSADKVELADSVNFQQVEVATQQTVDDTLKEVEVMLQKMNVNLDDLPTDRSEDFEMVSGSDISKEEDWEVPYVKEDSRLAEVAKRMKKSRGQRRSNKQPAPRPTIIPPLQLPVQRPTQQPTPRAPTGRSAASSAETLCPQVDHSPCPTQRVAFWTPTPTSTYHH